VIASFSYTRLRGRVDYFLRAAPFGEWKPQVLNSPETPVFSEKAKNFYGFYLSKNKTPKYSIKYSFEGYMDVIRASSTRQLLTPSPH